MNKKSGFTLIEVLVALMIIAIALTAALKASIQSTKATIHVKNSMVAHWVGLNILSEIQTGLIAPPVVDAVSYGKTNMLGCDWNWSARVASSAQLQQVNKITIIVERNNHFITSVTGYQELK